MSKRILMLSAIIVVVSTLLIYLAGLVFGFKSSLLSIIGSVLASGFFYSLFVAGVFQKVDSSSNNDIFNESISPDEELLFVGLSSIQTDYLSSSRAFLSDRGELFLTEKQLVFIGAKRNLEDVKVKVPLEDIKRIRKTSFLYLLNDGLRIDTKNEKVFVFYLEDREELFRLLKSLLHQDALVNVLLED